MKKRILVNLILFISILFGTQVYATETEELPSKYDLRNDINIKVENQGNNGWCLYFSFVKEVETYLQKTKGITYDLSEGYIAYSNSINAGSYTGEYVLQSNFPNTITTVTEANTKKFNSAKEKAIVKELTNINSNKMKNINPKEYIVKYGGIFLEMSVDDSIHYTKGSIYDKETRRKSETYNRPNYGGQHGVLVIGWDNNYSKDNFGTEKPENDGAWLILNSWGTDWANNGTAWLSYEDYDAKVTNMRGIEDLTLSTGEIIRTNLDGEKIEKEEVKETKNNTMQIIAGPNISGNGNVEGVKETEASIYENTYQTSEKMHLDEQDIMIICVLSALVLSVIIVTVIYCKKRKKTNNKKEADKEKETEKELSLK